MLGRTWTSDISQTGQKLSLPLSQLSLQEPAGQGGSRQLPQWLFQLWPQLWRSHLGLIGSCVWSELWASIWTEPQAEQGLATISSWIKQTVILCYEFLEALILHWVKDHDVSFLGTNPVSLPLEVTEHLHTILSEGCGLGWFIALPFGPSSGCSADPPIAHVVEEICTFVNSCT